MCITSGTSKMSKTLIYSGEARYLGKDVHVLAYQNNATSIGDLPNAMLLPIPATHGIKAEHLIDTREFKNFLKDMAKSTEITTKSLSFGKGISDAIEIIKVGNYHIITGSAAGGIFEAIKQIPEEKRPAISAQFLDDYLKHYAGYQIMLCCWVGSIEAEPIMVWYEPQNTDALFVPTADAHDGNMPEFGKHIRMDHTIMTNHKNRMSAKIVYTDMLPKSLAGLFPEFATATRISYQANGDSEIVVRTEKRPVIRPAGDEKHFGAEMYGWS